MAKYLFAHYSVEGEPRPAMNDEDMQVFMQRIVELEAEMKAEDALVFGGALHGNAARVVRASQGDVLTTDGPYVESKNIWAVSTSSRRTTWIARSRGRRRRRSRSGIRSKCVRSLTNRPSNRLAISVTEGPKTSVAVPRSPTAP